jgi:arylsulfatase A-like enzyme
VHLFDPHAPYDGHAEIFGDRFAALPYDGDIAFADVQIERLVQHLKDAGRFDDTLIVVAGDHGEGFGDHDELEHGFLLYNSTLRVPLIFSSPRLTQAGQRIVSLVDIAPTVLDCLQISSESQTSGVSLMTALDGGLIESRTCYSETISAFSAYGWAPLKCVTTDAWKYVDSTRDELFDLQNDPDEMNNLAESHPGNARDAAVLDVQARCPRSTSRVEMTESNDARRAWDTSAAGAVADPGEPLPDVKDKIPHYNAEVAARKLICRADRQTIAAPRSSPKRPST